MSKLILINLTVLCFGLTTLPLLNAQSIKNAIALSKEEQKVMDYIDTNMPRAIALLKESVDINSGTLNIASVKKVGAIFAREFGKANFKTKWVFMPDSLRRAGHLVAQIGFNNANNGEEKFSGGAADQISTNEEKKKSVKEKNEIAKSKNGKKLFLIGHLDTVFEPDMPANPFTMINDSTATGQGVNDMKGGDVVMIIALQALHAQGLLKEANIIAYLTGDEEHAANPRSLSRGDFIETAKQTDIALAFEGASGLNSVATARRGASGWRLDVKAKTGHSSPVFTQNSGYGAIYEAARIINEF